MTGPNQCATRPDSNPPSSLEVPIKRLFTAETRPRFSSGVSSCTKVCRTTTLMLSVAPQTKSMSRENVNDLEKPNPMVASPNPTTAQSSARPARSIGGRWAKVNAESSEPTGIAACRMPKPLGPTRKMSFA